MLSVPRVRRRPRCFECLRTRPCRPDQRQVERFHRALADEAAAAITQRRWDMRGSVTAMTMIRRERWLSRDASRPDQWILLWLIAVTQIQFEYLATCLTDADQAGVARLIQGGQ